MAIDESYLNIINEDVETKDKTLPNSIECDTSDSAISFRSSLSSISFNFDVIISKELNKSNTSLDTLNENENWRGLGKEIHVIDTINDKPKRSRPTKYMQSNKNIENVLNRRNMRSSLNTLLINGNNSSIIMDKKQKYLVQNTCAYDSVAVIISTAYIDNPNYKMFIDSNEDTFFKFCKTLATNGTVKILNKGRFNILKSIFSEDTTLSGIKRINTQCNVTYIIRELFKKIPSAIDYTKCTNTSCKNTKLRTIVLNHQALININRLEEALNDYVNKINYTCSQPHCDGEVTQNKILQQHLFIEADQVEDLCVFEMTDFPKNGDDQK
jgi:hypothetical protein